MIYANFNIQSFEPSTNFSLSDAVFKPLNLYIPEFAKC